MNAWRKKLGVLALVGQLVTLAVWGNTDNRRWTLASGASFAAELVSYDARVDVAVLRPEGGEKKSYTLKDFAPTDAAWLLEWAEFSGELDKLAAHMKGEFKHYQLSGPKHAADFYVYTPGKYKETTKLPMLILFHPSGKGARYVKQFMDAAETLGLIVVSSDAFHNTPDSWTPADEVMLDCFQELLPELEKTVPHDSRRLFMGGSSGGAQRAYHFSAKVDRPWAGIFANGGWLGGPAFYDWPFAKGMRVAMVNGNNDRPIARWLKPDTAILEKRECMVNLFVFEGGHQIPPPMIQFKALQWMLGEVPEMAPVQPVGGLIQLPATTGATAAPSQTIPQ